MQKDLVSKQLLELVGVIKTFDADNYQEKILNAVSNIFNFSGCFVLDVVDYETITFSLTDGIGDAIEQSSLLSFLENEMYSWPVEDGPYIAKFENITIIGIQFIQQTWGIFLSQTSLSPDHLESLNLFAEASDIWFRSSQLFYSSEPIKIDFQSERKFAALQHLYSISEWTWDFKSGYLKLSDSFLAFFDQVIHKSTFELSDFHRLIGSENAARFKECIDKVVNNHYQVLEEFKCPLIDGKTFQHIQMLFDIKKEEGEVVGVIGYCRDNGRSFNSENDSLKWYDSDWLHQLKILPLEWIDHSKGDCEITLSPFHCIDFKEDLDRLVQELETYLSDLKRQGDRDVSLNLSIQFPFSKYKYQLLAAKCDQEPLLWRGFMVRLEEVDNKSDMDNSVITFDAYNQRCIFQFLKALTSSDSVQEHDQLIQFLIGLQRYSVDEYSFSDFWSQMNEICTAYHQSTSIQHKMDDSCRVPYSQWVLSLVSFVINYFYLQHHPLTIQCTEPPIVESQNVRLLNSNHVMKIVLSTTTLPAVSDIIQSFFQMSLIGTGIDIRFLSNDFEWTCVIYVEIKVFEQPIIADTYIINETAEAPIKKTILVVDDDMYNTQTLEVLFQSDGFRTITANQGQQALRILDTMDSIHAIILDIKMPVMDGFELLSRIKSHEKDAVSSIPVVILSANITPDVTERLRKFNVHCIIEKPFDLEDIIAQINRVIKTKEVLEPISA